MSPLLWSALRPPLEGLARLQGLGSLASPRLEGTPTQAGGALLRRLDAVSGSLGAAFEADVLHWCGRLAAHRGALRVQAQLLQKIPGHPGGYAASAERLHLDLDAADPLREGTRLVRVYVGEGTRWLPRDREPVALRARRQGPPSSTLRAELDALAAAAPPEAEEAVAEGQVLVYRGGLREGLLHRAPQTTHPRLLLVVSIPDA